MSNIKIVLVWFLLFSVISVTQAYEGFEITLDDDASDQEDVEEHLTKARQKADNENFSGACEQIKKAKKFGVSQSEIKSAESYIASKKQAYEERIEQERQAKLEAERRTSSSSSSSSGSNDVSFVMVEAKFVGVLALQKNLKMWKADQNAYIGEFKPNFSGANSGAIHDIGNGVAGYYNYSLQTGDDKRICSGQVYVSGKKKYLHIDIYRDSCKISYVSEF